MPGDAVGMYGAITAGRNKTLFGRVCTLTACVWIMVDPKNLCIPGKSYSTTLSIDNAASAQSLLCVDALGMRSFEGNDTELTQLIISGRQIGITPPVGAAVVFNISGAAEAVATLTPK